MRVLVTGADGFIGSHLCELLRDYYDVTGMAFYNTRGDYGWLSGVDRIMGDVRDADQMRRLVPQFGKVFHLAALIDVPYSFTAARSYFETNVIGTLNIIEAALESGARVIHTSSSEVYGSARYTPMDEKHPLHAQSPYAASKIAADQLVQSYVYSRGLDAVILRPFNTYGPRQSDRAVISTIARQSHPVQLGSPYPKRDFTYVEDTCRAFMAVSDLPFGVYNAGSGKNVSIGELARMITDAPILWEMDARSRPEDAEVDELLCSAAKLHEATGWAPEVPLKEGLRRTIDSFSRA